MIHFIAKLFFFGTTSYCSCISIYHSLLLSTSGKPIIGEKQLLVINLCHFWFSGIPTFNMPEVHVILSLYTYVFITVTYRDFSNVLLVIMR